METQEERKNSGEKPPSGTGRYGEPWRPGKPLGTIVADTFASGKRPGEVPDTTGHGAADHYGGVLVAESMETSRRDRAVACVNACDGIEDPANLRAQRDALLEAAGGVASWLEELADYMGAAAESTRAPIFKSSLRADATDFRTIAADLRAAMRGDARGS